MGSFVADNMAAIIAECEEKLARKNAHYDEVARHARIKLKQAKKQHQITKNNKKLDDDVKAKRIEKLKANMLEFYHEITQARETKRKRGVIATGHYQITFTGDNATENFDNFLGWAFNCRQWQANTRNEVVKVELEQAKAELIDEIKADSNDDDSRIA